MKMMLLSLAAMALSAAPAMAAAAPKTPEVKAAMEMVDAWNNLDLDRIVNDFTEDGVLHSVMIEPIKGREAIKKQLAPLIAGSTRIELQIKNIAQVGKTVFLERVDDFDFKGRHGAVPVVGVMEIENGKVKVWREYYDRAELLTALGMMPEKKN